MTFEEWAAPLRYAPTIREAFLAGQESAEQRVYELLALVEDWKKQHAELEQALKVADEGRNYANELLSLKAQAGEVVGYHFSYKTPFGHVVWDIDHAPRPDAIEVYPVVRAHPTTERRVPMVGKCQNCGHEHEIPAPPAPSSQVEQEQMFISHFFRPNQMITPPLPADTRKVLEMALDALLDYRKTDTNAVVMSLRKALGETK